ncbi:hypothetical protein ROHU_009610 [Labeo rohita]|uniref:CxC3 like cysteine cluster domain-containing protein n=1 Tax=Labeo rohita TaxID=84645 RepID=A0A498LZA1_LABRO|nr:hypothetical protein ROHU_009610 [Labeo rohita]
MEYLCSTCDMEAHKRNVFHDREAVFHGFLEPIPPTTAVVVNENGQPQFCEQICQLPVPAPRSICECTHDFTITPGKHISVVTINGRYDVCLPRKSCSSCSAEWTPEVKDLLTYRYWPASTSCQTLYKFDVFTSFEHMKVTAPAMSRQAFLKMLEHRSVQAGRANESAVCGTAKFTAGREMSKKSGAQIDEEGIQVAVCRHGFLLRGLNHYRGEIFAYPMFLQREMSKKANVTFFCMDVTCRYWPYLNKVAEGLPELLPLTEMRPFLSVMHAKAHTAKCEVRWGGRSQDGAGNTVGEEVEQITERAKLEAASLSNIEKEHNLDQETIQQWVCDVRQWAVTERVYTPGCTEELRANIENITVTLLRKKKDLYRRHDSNQARQRKKKKMTELKKKLREKVLQYNTVVEGDPIDEELACSLTEGYILPWERHKDGNTFRLKRSIFDQVMLLKRLEEEQSILLKEMSQHIKYLLKQVQEVESLRGQTLERIKTSTFYVALDPTVVAAQLRHGVLVSEWVELYVVVCGWKEPGVLVPGWVELYMVVCGWKEPGVLVPEWVELCVVVCGWKEPGVLVPGWVEPGVLVPGWVEPGVLVLGWVNHTAPNLE